jgi:hypothetical protein
MIFKNISPACQPIQIWGFYVAAPIAAQFGAEVIDTDKKDIGLLVFLCWERPTGICQ